MIPKIIHQFWVGPHPPPLRWMKTWEDKHPDYTFYIWGNNEVARYPWDVNVGKHIEHYSKSRAWYGVADVCRYQLLYDFGGFWAPADSESLVPIDELVENNDFFTVYTNEKHRPGDVAPILGITPKHPFLKYCITRLGDVTNQGRDAVERVGNRFYTRCLNEQKPKVNILPSYTFIPNWKGHEMYKGPDTVYADHFWGSTKSSVHKRYKDGR